MNGFRKSGAWGGAQELLQFPERCITLCGLVNFIRGILPGQVAKWCCNGGIVWNEPAVIASQTKKRSDLLLSLWNRCF